jgi:hypothetical protein
MRRDSAERVWDFIGKPSEIFLRMWESEPPPTPDALSDGESEDRAEENVGDGVNRERPVRERPVQVHRCRAHGGLREPDGDQQRDRGVGGGQQSGGAIPCGRSQPAAPSGRG